MDIIQSALLYHDSNLEKNRGIINSDVSIDFNKTNDIEFQMMGEVKFRAKYEVMGSYKDGLWRWGWSDKTLIPILKQKSIEILTYGINTDNQKIKEETITPKFLVTDPIQLDIHVSIGSYITKTEIVYTLDIGDTKYYLFIY